MRWTLSVRWLVGTLVIVALVAPGLYALNAYQVRRNASALLERAKVHEDKEEWLLAAQDVHRYLQLCPDEPAATIRRARDFDKGSLPGRDKVRAAQLYAAAMVLAPHDDDLRTRHMELLLETGDPADSAAALKEAETLLPKAPAAASRVRALALHQQRRSRGTPDLDDVVSAYQTALAAQPGNDVLAIGLAMIYRREMRPTGKLDRAALDQRADDVMDAMVVASQDRAAAFFARFAYRSEFRLPGAEADLEQARQADADQTKFLVWWQSGQNALVAAAEEGATEKARRLDDAVRYLQIALNIAPADRRGYISLGTAYRRSDDPRQAIVTWKDGLRHGEDDDIEVRLLIIDAGIRLIDWDEVRQAPLEANRDLADVERGLDEAEKLIDREVGPERGRLLSWLSFFRAEVAEGKGELAKAVPLFAQALDFSQAGALVGERAARVSDIELRLARCHAALGAWDQAAWVAQQAADLRPDDVGPRLTAADAWLTAGRLEAAVDQYEAAILLEDVPPAAYASLVDAECLRQCSLPSPQRDWSRFSEALAQARERIPDSILLQIAEGEYDAERGFIDQAIARWQASEPGVLDNIGLCRRLLLDYQRHGRPDCADRFLSVLEDDSRLSVVNRKLLSADVKFMQKRPDDALRVLEEALTEVDAAGRRELLFRQAMIHLHESDRDQARLLFERLAADDPDNPRPLVFLAELALQAGAINDVMHHVKKLEKLEGTDGTNWRFYRAQRMLAQVPKLPATDDSQAARQASALMRQAAELQREIEERRPAWPEGFLLKGKLALMARPPDEAAAIQALGQAIRLDHRNKEPYDAIIKLLCRQNRLVEAKPYMARRRALDSLPPDLATMAMAIDVRLGNNKDAIETAREQVELAPNDAEAHLRLAEILALESAGEAAHDEEAESEFRRACDLAPDDFRTWSDLLAFYNMRAKPADADSAPNSEALEKARQLLEEVAGHDASGGAELPLFLARGYAALAEVAGEAHGGSDYISHAETWHRKALAAAPDDTAVQLQVAGFFRNRDTKYAEQLLRRIVDTKSPERTIARQWLAELVAIAAKDDQGLEEASQLLSGADAPPINKRLNAFIQMNRGGDDHQKTATKLLRELADDPTQVAAIDRLLLARLYEAQGQMAAAREQLKILVNVDKPEPNHLAAYIDNLLRSDRSSDARSPLETLAQLEPAEVNLRTLSLKGRWLVAEDRKDEVGPLVAGYVAAQRDSLSDDANQAKTLVSVGDLLASLPLNEEAERFYRQAFALEPAAHLSLATWLSKQDRTSEAVAVCLQAAERDSSTLPAIVLTNVLTVGAPSDADLKLAEPMLSAALEQHADDPTLLFSTGTRHLMKGDADEAVRLFRRVLELRPKEAQAMNNLAMALALTPDSRDEAIEWLDNAIGIVGRNPELLDSKGWLLLQEGKLPEAIQSLNAALANPPGDARHRFHLAFAYHLEGKRKDARREFEKAERDGLDADLLSPAERTDLAKLKTALAGDTSSDH